MIADNRAATVWQAVPTVVSLRVLTHLGVPLIVGGQPIGSFCAIDAKSRDWNPHRLTPSCSSRSMPFG